VLYQLSYLATSSETGDPFFRSEHSPYFTQPCQHAARNRVTYSDRSTLRA
jgi:hypothetical protein